MPKGKVSSSLQGSSGASHKHSNHTPLPLGRLLHAKGEGFRKLAAVLGQLFPEAVQRVHRAGAVDVHHRVELQWQPPAACTVCCEAANMAQAFLSGLKQGT